jgi:hypothetical protein
MAAGADFFARETRFAGIDCLANNPFIKDQAQSSKSK